MRRTFSRRPKSAVGIATGYPLDSAFTEPLHRGRSAVTAAGYLAQVRIVAIGFLALLLLVPVGIAASTRTVTAPATVTALALEGSRIAYASGRSPRDCNRIHVWNLATRGVTRFPRPTTCVETSTGSGVYDLGIAGTRILWVHFIGGNLRESTLWTATTTQPRPRRLRSVTRDVDDPAPLVVGDGDVSRFGDLLPYAHDDEVVVLRVNGARRFAWIAPGRVTALSALDGELAVASAGGTVTVLDQSGAVLRTETFAAEVQAVELTRSGLLVQRGRRGETLELRVDDGESRTWSLPRGARLEDAQGARAYYVVGGQIRELRLDAVNRQRQVGLGSHVQVDGSRLATSNGRRVLLRQPLP